MVACNHVRPIHPHAAAASIASLLLCGASAQAKSLIDYFLPTPIVGSLSKTAWGVADVGPRDQKNGLEDTANKSYSYWDGKIFKGADGTYHLYGSRWAESKGHSGWSGSVAVHATSANVIGPYLDKGLAWSNNQNGKGHNITGAPLQDGTYMLIAAGTRPGDLFTSAKPEGPWTFLGSMTWDGGTAVTGGTNNTSIIQRPDGTFIGIGRYGEIFTAPKLIGPYKVQSITARYQLAKANEVYAYVAGGNSEDPVMWYSGGYYHVTYNYWNLRKAYHLMSKDGITNWRNMGIAYDPTKDFIRYTDGTINHWYKIERPGVFIQNGHITHWTMAVVDVDKALVTGGSGHNSKVIVIPFDGELFDKEMGEAYCKAEGGTNCTATEVAPRNLRTSRPAVISRREGSWAIDVSGLAAGATIDVALFSPDGRTLASRSIRSTGADASYAWSELRDLPRGMLLRTRCSVDGKVVDQGNFIRW